MNSIPKTWFEKIALISSDDKFQNSVAQITSKSMLKEITDKIPSHNWSYSEPAIVRNASTLSLMIQNIALTDPKNLKDTGQSTIRLATLWENIARLKEKTAPNLALMNSAVCYELAGYQANATCMARKISSNVTDEKTVEYLSSLFLQRLFLTLRMKCQELLVEPQEYDNEFELIRRIGLAAVADGFLKASSYFLTGNNDDIKQADEQFASAGKLFSELMSVGEFNLVRKIQSLLKPMTENSTWHILRSINQGNFIWERYLRLLARGTGLDLLNSTSISEIWPSQKNAIDRSLFDVTLNKVVKMPTSAGKTRIAELAIVDMLIKNPGSKCVYVAPYRALVSELEDNFINLFGDLGFRVSSIIGTFEKDPFEEKLVEDADILILTPEKLDLLLRTRSELLDSTKLFILDEGHIIDSETRGIKLELLFTRLKRKLNDARFILISAVLPDETVKQYLEWFNATSGGEIKSDWRPSIQQHAKFKWSSTENTGTLRYEARKENQLINTFVPGIISQKKYKVKNSETGRYRNPKFPNDTKSEIAAEIAYKFSQTGPVLVFTTQGNWVESIANKLLTRIKYSKDVGEEIPLHFQDRDSISVEISKEWLGGEHPITELLRNGIAIHHGKMPDALRRSIESDYRERKFMVIISTNTLAQGVNLPIKTIIMHSCRRTIQNSPERISSSEYWNIAGRAGRAGQETEGTTIHIVKTSKDQRDYIFYQKEKNNLKPIQGALLKILEQLVDKNFSDDELRKEIDVEVLALLMEEGGLEQFSEKIDDIINHSLVSFQTSDKDHVSELVKGFKRVGQMITEEIPADYLKTFSSTGLSSESCLTIKLLIEENQNTINSLITNSNSENNLELLSLIINAFETVSEMKPKSKYPGNSFDLIKKWLSGQNINEIISSEQSQESTQTAKFIEEYFGYLLPWGISSFLRIAQKIMKIDDYELTNDVRYLASMVKYGVPKYEASWLMMMGLPFRDLAMRLVSKYISEHNNSDHTKLITWVSNLDSESLQSDFGVESLFLKDVSKTLIKTGINPLLKENKSIEEVIDMPTWISKIKFENRHVAASKVRNDERLILTRQYDNPYDRNAVKVLSADKLEIGYLNRNLAQFIAPYIDGGLNIHSRVVEIHHGAIPKIKIKLEQE